MTIVGSQFAPDCLFGPRTIASRAGLLALILLVASYGLSVTAVSAQTVPGSFIWAAEGSGGAAAGRLYRVDPTTAAATLVGNITVAGVPIRITGLAVHPATLVLYGSVSNASPNHFGNLVTIDRTTAAATLVGPFNVPGCGCNQTLQDLTFRSDGTLFGSSGQSPDADIYRVNLATGAVTLVGTDPGVFAQGGRGLSLPTTAHERLPVSHTSGHVRKHVYDRSRDGPGY